MPRGRLHQLVIPLAALIPILPLILHGCSCGHDFDFHILSWLEAARQFTHGNLHPHWAFTPAYNAGEPRFVFYPPISWTLGAILGLIFPWSWTPILYTWIVLTAAGLSMHRLARTFASPAAALLASVFYIANPYMLFTAYERTAYAELLAAIWIPLLFHAILRDSVTIPSIAIPVALLWLTNAPAAVMSCYALALLAAVKLITTPGAPSIDSDGWESHASATALARTVTSPHPRLKLALTTTAGTILGLGLASIYLVPAAYERRYIQFALAVQPGFRIQDNFLFHHMVTGLTDPAAIADALLHDQVLHTIAIIAILLLTLTLLAVIAAGMATARGKKNEIVILSEGAAEVEGPAFQTTVTTHAPQLTTNNRQPTTSIAILTLTILTLLTPISLPIWNHLPELAFLQFPWRILALLAAALSLTLATAFTRLRLNARIATAIALAITAALTYPAYRNFNQHCDPEDTVTAQVALFHSNPQSGPSTVDPSDEYTPITADNDSLAHNNPPYWLAPEPTAPAPANSNPGIAPLTLTLNSPIPQSLILNLRDYPAWHITLNDAPAPAHLERPDGLIAIPIPAGPTQIHITYSTLPDQIIGTLLSVLSLSILSVLTLRNPT